MHGFSDEERERIHEQLIETGRELLLTYGPEKTTVVDITEPVGIAKSTFYRFFDSKAELYLVILQREMEEFVETVQEELAGIEDPRDGLERFFWCYAAFAEENQFVRQTVIQGNYRETFRSVDPEKREAMQEEELSEFMPIIEDLQARSDGPLAEVDPLVILGLMGGSVGLMALHRDEFEEYDADEGDGNGEGYYRRVQDVLISSIARGLTAE